MPRLSNPVPSYARQKAKNLADCSVRLPNGRKQDIYLGSCKSAASKAEYAHIVAPVSANGGIYSNGSQDLTVNEALVRYIKHVDAYYQNPDGTPADSATKIKMAGVWR